MVGFASCKPADALVFASVVLTPNFAHCKRGTADNGSWVVGQMGQQIRMSHVGHGSVPVTH